MIEQSAAPPLLSGHAEITDWDAQYRCGTPPWETGLPSPELVRAVRDRVLRPMPTLELGCGTGADAVFLAQRGFEVTAVDLSPTAIERARTRAERSGALLRIVLDDVFEFAEHCGTFDLVYDAGFYQYVRRTQLSRFLDLLWRVTSPGSLYFALAVNPGKEVDLDAMAGEAEIRFELGRLFEFIDLRTFRPEGPDGAGGTRAWSCLMRRPIVAGQRLES